MDDKILRRSLLDALSWASLRNLPEKDTGECVWICALALVSKRDGTKSYVALRKGENGENRVVKDFGSISIIAKIEEEYPYVYLDKQLLPDFKGQKKEDRIKWLMANGVDGNLDELTVKELNKKILSVAMKQQLKTTR